MRLWKVSLLVAGLGLLLILVSCSSAEVSRDDTEMFLGGLYLMVGQAMTDEASQLLMDFEESDPPAPELMSYLGVASATKLRDPFGLDTLYGTWVYDGNTWDFDDPGNPANALLFVWPYLDTAYVAHTGEFLIDSLEFYEDTLPENLWMGVFSDDELLAWLKLEAEYLSLDEVSEVSLIYEIVNHFQIGISISSAAAIDSIFTGTVSLWAINRTNGYRVDLIVTFEENFPVEIVLSDSDGWRMEVAFSDVVATDGEYERRNVSGEVTENGHPAAEISGYVWYRILEDYDVEIDDEESDVVITFTDDTYDDFVDYLPIF